MKLTRSTDDRWLGGVAGGFAAALNVDAAVVRVVFALITFFAGSGILIYIALWIIMPRAEGGSIAEDGLHKAKDWYRDRRQPPASGF